MGSALALALLLALTPFASFAGIVTYDFTVNGGASGPLAGVTSTGYFSYDDSKAKPYAQLESAVTDFLFTWGGITYDRTIVEVVSIWYGWDGKLGSIMIGTNCDIGGHTCYGSAHTNDWTLYGSPDGYFHYGLGIGQNFSGSYTLTQRSVPEPGMLSLMLAGVAGIGLFARRRRPLIR